MIDQMVRNSQYYTVVDDWDCMLNQTKHRPKYRIVGYHELSQIV